MAINMYIGHRYDIYRYIGTPLLELYSIHRRNVGASLIEINERMSELLDKQVDTPNHNLKI